MTSSGYFPVVGWDFHFRTVPRVWKKLPKNIFLYEFLNKKLASSPWQQADALNQSSGHALSHTGHLLSIAPGEKPQMCRDLCVRMFTKWWTIEKNAHEEITYSCNDTKKYSQCEKTTVQNIYHIIPTFKMYFHSWSSQKHSEFLKYIKI